VQGASGFRAAEALAIYGSLDAITQACRDCPANSNALQDSTALAGCFGLLPLPLDAAPFHVAVERAIEEQNILAEVERHFPPTRLPWYGFWQSSPLASEQLAPLAKLLAAVQTADAECRRGLAELLLALQAAQRHKLALHVRHYPRGEVSGPWWRHVPHCPRCQAEWPEHADHCRACQYIGQPAPIAKRHARGTRPYFPLARLLGEQSATAFLARYHSSQT
jgi:hypothetical protein